MRVAYGALALLLVVPLGLTDGSARFVDPLPHRLDPIRIALAVPGFMIAGQESGLVVGMDEATGVVKWSAFTGELVPVRGLEFVDGRVLIAQSSLDRARGNLSAINPATGRFFWEVGFSTGVTGVSADAGKAYASFADGSVSQIDLETGSRLWSQPHPAPARAIDAAGGRLALAAGSQVLVLDAANGVALASAFQEADHVALMGSRVFSLALDGSLKAFDLSGAALTVRALPSGLPTGLSALDAGFGRVVLGDRLSFLYTYDADLNTVVPGIGTFANAVNHVRLLDGENAIAGFEGGWVGIIPLKAQPIVLILWPQPARFATSPITFEWAYAHPTADAGDTVDHTVQIRLPGEPTWRTIASGTSPVERVTKIRQVEFDLGAFASGTLLEVRVLMTDKNGRTGEDAVLWPFQLDRDAPYLSRDPSPGRGETVCRVQANGTKACTARPTILVAHNDRHSGVEPERTRFWFDGELVTDGWRIERGRSLTTMTPLENLDDGRHLWRIEVQDTVGNFYWWESSFIIDARAPEVTDARLTKVTSQLVALAFNTTEPARCLVQTTDARSIVPETEHALGHAIALTGLSPSTAYTVRAACADPAGKTSTRDILQVTTRDPGPPGPKLTIETTPTAPDGANGWYVSPTGLRLTVNVDPGDSRVWSSVDGSVFADVGATFNVPNGTHEYRFFAVRSDETSASNVQNVTIKYDPTPPPSPAATWSPTLSVLSWTTTDDPDSHVATYILEAQGRTTNGQYQALQEFVYPASRFDALDPSLERARVIAVNGAGLRTEGPAAEVASASGDTVYTLAVLPNTRIYENGEVRVNVRLAPGAQYMDGLLVTADGVEKPFSSKRTLGPYLVQGHAQASNVGDGRFDVYANVLEEGQTKRLYAGNLTILPVTPATTSPSPIGPTRPPIDTPMAPSLVLLALAAGLLASRRRS